MRLDESRPFWRTQRQTYGLLPAPATCPSGRGARPPVRPAPARPAPGLPPELWGEVAEHLPPQDALRLAATSRAMARVVQDTPRFRALQRQSALVPPEFFCRDQPIGARVHFLVEQQAVARGARRYAKDAGYLVAWGWGLISLGPYSALALTSPNPPGLAVWIWAEMAAQKCALLLVHDSVLKAAPEQYLADRLAVYSVLVGPVHTALEVVALNALPFFLVAPEKCRQAQRVAVTIICLALAVGIVSAEALSRGRQKLLLGGKTIAQEDFVLPVTFLAAQEHWRYLLLKRLSDQRSLAALRNELQNVFGAARQGFHGSQSMERLLAALLRNHCQSLLDVFLPHYPAPLTAQHLLAAMAERVTAQNFDLLWRHQEARYAEQFAQDALAVRAAGGETTPSWPVPWQRRLHGFAADLLWRAAERGLQTRYYEAICAHLPLSIQQRALTLGCTNLSIQAAAMLPASNIPFQQQLFAGL